MSYEQLACHGKRIIKEGANLNPYSNPYFNPNPKPQPPRKHKPQPKPCPLPKPKD
jgi:hypothetical protein